MAVKRSDQRGAKQGHVLEHASGKGHLRQPMAVVRARRDPLDHLQDKMCQFLGFPVEHGLRDPIASLRASDDHGR